MLKYILDNILIAIRFSLDDIERRFWQYDEHGCESYLEKPKVYVKDIYSKCNLKFDDYLKEEIKSNNFNGFLDINKGGSVFLLVRESRMSRN